jgi:hypothetical protein
MTFNPFKLANYYYGKLKRIYNDINELKYNFSEFYEIFCVAHLRKYRDPRHLVHFHYGVYSQHKEDGMIAEIFRRILPSDHFFVEFGVDAVQNNTLALLLQRWKGLWIEADPEKIARLNRIFARILTRGQLKIKLSSITAENINDVLREAEVADSFDLLSIDVDGNDYWFWKAMTYRPRVVVIEYNASFGPNIDCKARYDPRWRWKYNRAFGASLKALELLGREKGYSLVGCDIAGTNAFFVRDDLVQGKFVEPFTSEFHFESAKYYLWYYPGHDPTSQEIDLFFD